MKKIVFVLGLIAAASASQAATPVAETPVKSFGTPVTISIDNSTLTKVPSSQASGRVGIFLDSPATNSGKIVGFFGNCTSTALANTIRPIEVSPTSNSSYFSMREDVCLWLITTNASPESVHYQEVIQ